MKTGLERSRVLVVGGSSGIGLAVAAGALERGARVAVASRGAPGRMAALAEPMSSIEAHSFDITLQEDHAKLLASVGPVDHLVVAVRPEVRSAPFPTLGVDEAKRAFETKFWGQYGLILNALRHMSGTGSITLTSGIAGEKICRGASTTALINSATETLCRSLAVELAPLRVNCVSPGFVEPKPQAVQEQARQFPAGRLASPDEIASAYLWLMENPYATGTILAVDGGARLI